MTISEYDDLLKRQDNSCIGCLRFADQFKRKLNVDHNHKSGKIRGILCTNCNMILGFAYDNPNLLKRLAKYLENDGFNLFDDIINTFQAVLPNVH